MRRFAIIDDGVVTNIAEADEPLADNWIADNGDAKIGGAWDGQSFHPPAPPVPSLNDYTSAVQIHLDNMVKERNYDGILSACTYATSSVPKFAAEGHTCVTWRDAVWATCYQILGEVESGQRPTPSVEDLIALLPIMTWPEVV